MMKYAILLFALLVLVATMCKEGHTAERVCIRYENIEIEECTSTRARNAVGGAVLGALGGYMLGGKRGAGWGAGGGAALGAVSGDKKCTKRVEKHCIEYIELTNATH